MAMCLENNTRKTSTIQSEAVEAATATVAVITVPSIGTGSAILEEWVSHLIDVGMQLILILSTSKVKFEQRTQSRFRWSF